MTRMLTGERPTGPLHIGHLFGHGRQPGAPAALGRRDAARARRLPGGHRPRGRRVTWPGTCARSSLDYLAAGIDPDTATIFTHSAVPALHQLMLPFLSLVSVAELERNPTVKQELADSGRSMSGLLLTYPVHQAADILFCHADVVPVGRDQLPHLELTRTIARRFTAALRTVLHRAGARAVGGAGRAGHRRPQDEQEPRERHRAAGERRRDGPCDPVREDRLGPGDHLRPVVATRGGQPAAARVAVHGRPAGGDRRRDRVRRRGPAQGGGRRRARRAPGSAARPPRPVRRRARAGGRHPGAGERTRERARGRHDP